eukprot:ANDGO_01011.mRNA.1 hypothetical protein CAOG_03474
MRIQEYCSCRRRRSCDVGHCHFLLLLMLLMLLVSAAPLVVRAAIYECPTAPMVAEDRRIDTSRLSVSTFNLYWFFNVSDLAINPWKNLTDVTQHVRNVARIIRIMDSDVVNLVEVQDCGMLNWLVEEIGASARYKPYLLFGTDTSTRQNVALLTRVDPTITLARSSGRSEYPVVFNGFDGFCAWNGAKSSTSLSKHYLTKLSFPQFDLALMGLHFIAIPTDPARCSQREAQAVVAAAFMKQFSEDLASTSSQPVEQIILGDFNDYADDVVDSFGNRPASRAAFILRNTSRSDGELFNVANLVSPQERYTDWWDRNQNGIDEGLAEHSMIDHILVSPGLRNRILSVSIPHLFVGDLYYSDHYPVTVVLDMTSNSTMSRESSPMSAPIQAQITPFGFWTSKIVKSSTSCEFSLSFTSSSPVFVRWQYERPPKDFDFVGSVTAMYSTVPVRLCDPSTSALFLDVLNTQGDPSDFTLSFSPNLVVVDDSSADCNLDCYSLAVVAVVGTACFIAGVGLCYLAALAHNRWRRRKGESADEKRTMTMPSRSSVGHSRLVDE